MGSHTEHTPSASLPDMESIIQLKGRERAKLANPFNSTKLKFEKFEKAAEKRKGKSSSVLDPSYEACGDVVEGSATSMATLPFLKRRLEVRTV
jgi:hypothetical protein